MIVTSVDPASRPEVFFSVQCVQIERPELGVGTAIASASSMKSLTFAVVRHFALSCGLLLIPLSVWNIALTGSLPPSFAPAEFWRDIPVPLAFTENSLRLAVFILPFLMPLDLAAPGRIRALFVFAAGTLLYFASWLALILFPSSAWSSTALGFAAPAYTPALWLLGIALLGRQLFWGSFYRWWMYAALAIAFLAAHISHAALVFARTHSNI